MESSRIVIDMSTTHSPRTAGDRLLDVLMDGDLVQARSIVADGVMPGTMGMLVSEVRDGLAELAAAGMIQTRPQVGRSGAIWSLKS